MCALQGTRRAQRSEEDDDDTSADATYQPDHHIRRVKPRSEAGDERLPRAAKVAANQVRRALEPFLKFNYVARCCTFAHPFLLPTRLRP